MSFFAFSTGLWVILSVLIAYKPPSDFVLLINKYVYVFGIFLVTSFVHLSIIYPIPIVRFDRLHAYLLYLPTTLFSVISICTDSIVSNTIGGNNNVGVPIGGSIFGIYNIYLAILYITGVIILLFQAKRTDGDIHKNLMIVVWSFIIGGLPAVYIDLFGTTFHLVSPNYLIGNIATAVWLGSTSYILLKRS